MVDINEASGEAFEIPLSPETITQAERCARILQVDYPAHFEESYESLIDAIFHEERLANVKKADDFVYWRQVLGYLLPTSPLPPYPTLPRSRERTTLSNPTSHNNTTLWILYVLANNETESLERFEELPARTRDVLTHSINHHYKTALRIKSFDRYVHAHENKLCLNQALYRSSVTADLPPHHACTKCVKANRICTRTVQYNQQQSLCFFPLPQSGVPWHEAGHWLQAPPTDD